MQLHLILLLFRYFILDINNSQVILSPSVELSKQKNFDALFYTTNFATI